MTGVTSGCEGRVHSLECTRSLVAGNLLQMIEPYWRRVGGAAVGPWGNRNDYVLTLFAVDAIHVQKDVALLNAELRSLANGQKHRMFRTLWTDMKNHTVGFKDVLLAERRL